MQSQYYHDVPNPILKAFKSKFDTISLTVTSKQAQSPSDDDDSSDLSGSSDSATTKYPHYKSNKKVAETINKNFSESGVDQFENTKITYKDPIFYVSVPNDIASVTSSQQKEFYEKIARTIHSYQRIRLVSSTLKISNVAS